MALVTAPRNGIPIGLAKVNGMEIPVTIHPEYLRFFEGILARAGGVSGAGTDDLVLSQFEDAGIEEHKLALFKLTDDAGQFPPSNQADASADWLPPPVVHMPPADDVTPGLEELRAQVVELTKAVEALQQGLTA